MHVTDASIGYRKYDNSTLEASQHLEISAAQVCKVSFKCITWNPYRELTVVINVFFLLKLLLFCRYNLSVTGRDKKKKKSCDQHNPKQPQETNQPC